MKTTAKTLLATLGLITALGVAGGASAETRFQATHPARAEVNMREARLGRHIAIERHEGFIRPIRARMMDAELRHVRREERVDARFHRGHLTRFERYRLNREENRVVRQF